MTATVVVGPPCAGKSTYAWATRTTTELVVDYDRMAQALGSSTAHAATGAIREAAFAAREAAIGVALDTSQGSWVLHTSPSAEQISTYEDAGAEFVLLDPGESVCLERAEDDDRPEGTEDAIRAWYANPPELPDSTTTVSATTGRTIMASDNPRGNRYWGDVSLPKTKAEFFNAVTAPAPAGTGTVATLRLYGPIDSYGGFWGISAKDVGAVLDALPDTVTQINLRVNSPGGEVFEGVSILNMLRSHKASVTAVVDGRAASAASIIAAGCDETVMSPGTQMMIHSPSVIMWGNAAELRKQAEVLDGIEASMVEIYTAKAGEKDWTTLLADETWLTAAQAVDMGLADRTAVIPDAGEATTVGEDDDADTLVIPDEDDEDASAKARVVVMTSRPVLGTELPSSSEPGEPTRKEDVVAYDDLKAGLRERLGLTDAAASDTQLLAAVDEVLAEQVEPTTPARAAVQDGTLVVDAAVFEQLQSDARAGRAAREEQVTSRHEALVTAAVNDGRIAPVNRDRWLASFGKDEESASALLSTLPKNSIPVAELGHSDPHANADDSLYAQVYGSTPEEA
ncbi:head maturation protease, ClpP-related [Pseudoclavibacter sp. 8L]|uniref:head maturation protease, ClpP-related n=1 Tax=Pseudoclavibacter sp. 8L TaxID=2653162 RepID=UPI0012F1876C|nr:head maturation protease, ClpP-related [Pseudoclavibacter sp. 8L]VXB33002.1 ATP-dependent Clp protease proteolytic subunit (modular protein) [Pseudoclavibacter sp. 8L]